MAKKKNTNDNRESLNIKNDLCEAILKHLKGNDKICKESNIYAIAFDVGEFNFCIRYQTIDGLDEIINTQYEGKSDYKTTSLTGSKYSVGDFQFTDYGHSIKMDGYLKRFFITMAYLGCGYVADENKDKLIPENEMPENGYQLLLDTLVECANELNDKLDFISKTDDFILFVVEHDSSQEKFLNLVSKTVEKDLFNNLLNE